ncbi:glycosyltransferase [Telluribacter sp. SYSU D00476]|uniref:CgeB family protein n=1 Tax=Telluribacter sp. SYSU D00476 TaxID=2811430 RepID=UPI001FF39A9F|nr:glycosyltransferase [Telluribacter sp. SYSU D00476]
MKQPLKIAFFGSSLVSAYWNGAATYYRGIIKELHKLGHDITFFEPDAYERQQHRDLPDVDWATSVVYDATTEALEAVLTRTPEFDILIKTSGIGVFDEYLEERIPQLAGEDQLIIFWDVDAPATLDRMQSDPNDAFREHVKKYDLVLTYGGGDPVVEAYTDMGAKACIPVYNALDPETHHPVEKDQAFDCHLAFLGNRLPDREQRVEEFFIKAAASLPQKNFMLGGNGWHDKPMPSNIKYLGHVYTKDHNALNCTAMAVLNISRDSMAKYGFSPATRVFEAAGARACIITDHWKGIEMFFEPDQEILIAETGAEVAQIMATLSPERAAQIGKAAYERVLRDHTYAQRAQLAEALFMKNLKTNRKEVLS